MSKRIYIADDELNIRELMHSFLEKAGYEVRSFQDGDALLTAFYLEPADLVVLDIMMPGTDGLQICNKLRNRCSVPIIIVSARDSELDRITGITMGSDDYLVKPFSPLELVARINGIFRRIELDRGRVAQTSVSYGNILLNSATHEARFGGNPVSLTPTEFLLLFYLFSNSERAVSRDELIKNVWQFESNTDTRAADDVLKRLRKKLACSDVSIESVWGFGFKLARKDPL
jgi:DNA-binding response OmpR family regulator